MVQQNEVIALILGFGVLIFVLIHRRRITQVPAASSLLGTFIIFLAANILTVLEDAFFNDLLNLIEHVCYVAGSVLLARYAFRIFAGRRFP